MDDPGRIFFTSFLALAFILLVSGYAYANGYDSSRGTLEVEPETNNLVAESEEHGCEDFIDSDSDGECDLKESCPRHNGETDCPRECGRHDGGGCGKHAEKESDTAGSMDSPAEECPLKKSGGCGRSKSGCGGGCGKAAPVEGAAPDVPSEPSCGLRNQ